MPGSKLFVAQKQCSLLQLYGAPPSGRSHGGRYPMTRIYGHCWRGSSHLRRAHAGNWTRPRWAADTFRSAYSGIPEKAQRSGYLEGPNVVSAAIAQHVGAAHQHRRSLQNATQESWEGRREWSTGEARTATA